ncbi:fatty acid CoA ligase family protein [Actomonas aquatica]|uniref:Fatty acid CoA ligase family protein n=1 Tax=Actomonas aquatica TaxID=2866162 RepID=A0ABZ1C315_9BACT|nr:fatty acid CoA ligase family protein [Opitutus sp. WL0086]WRQ86096.1 fatty acid CoA ligase family protein [Opitutus sp. WL0086]
MPTPPPPPADSANIARHLPRMAASQPHTPALKIPRGRTADGAIDYLTLSFAELEAEAAAWQHRLRHAGVQRGDRVLVMVRQGLPLIASVFALFAHGAVPVVIDPGMGRKSFLACVRRTQPRALLGIPLARLLSHLFRGAFKSVRIRIAARGDTTARLSNRGDTGKLAVAASTTDELAAILFTSGSTGAPKGVCYAHGMFNAQVELIRHTFEIRPGEVDLPMLPIFALFNPALGMTTVVPEIDPSKPAAVDPAKIVQAITQEQVTNSFGSPTLWHKIARHCHAQRLTLPTMKRVLSAGAPVPPALWELMRPILTNGELHSPYGATEALPVATIDATTVIEHTAAATRTGAGTCVGHIIAPNEVKIIALTDDPIATESEIKTLPPLKIGEIIVRGPTVTQSYDALPDATARAKIPANSDLGFSHLEPGISGGSAAAWHRMGDCGYLDDYGRLWFCGRAAERVETATGPLFTEQVEPIFNQHAAVRRTALVGLGQRPTQRPALVIEPRDPQLLQNPTAATTLIAELRTLAADHPHAARVEAFYLHPGFPVDVRHNAKIHRLTLAKWAATAKPSGPP